MSRSESKTTVVIQHDGHGSVTLTVGDQTCPEREPEVRSRGMVARFSGDHKYPRTRRPFWAYTAETALWTRRGTRKVDGEAVVAFVAGLGVPRKEALGVVNEALAYLGWPLLAREALPGQGRPA